MSYSIRIFAALLSTSVFAGCISDADDFTTSNFAAAVAVGTSSAEIANSTLTQRQTGSDVNSDGDGYAYETGVQNGEGFFPRAGLIPGTSVSSLPRSGSARMSGHYEAARVTGIDLNNGRLTGFARTARGSMTLTADFDDHTLKGTSNNGILNVSGTFAGQTLEGDVVYSGIPGTLSGKIGGDEAIGIFNGKSESAIMAGGFIVAE